jgi:hypothetical protein
MKVYYITQKTIKTLLLIAVVVILGIAAWDAWQTHSAKSPQYNNVTPLLPSAVSERTEGLDHYTIDVNLDAKNHKLHAVQNVMYTNRESTALKEVYFHLYPNAYRSQDTAPFEKQDMASAYPNGFSAGGIDIKSVKINGKPVSFEITGRDNTVMKLILPSLLQNGRELEIDMEYDIILPNSVGRFGYGDYTFNITNWYPILAVYDKGGWHTDPYYAIGDPFYSDMADYDVTITAPSSFTIASTGAITGTDKQGDKQHWTVSAKAVRDFAWVASDNFSVLQGKIGDTTVRSYHFSRQSGQKALEYASDALSIFNDAFGLYPYGQFSVVQADFFIGGMEYPNLVMIDQSLYTSMTRDILEYVVVHETAHQWWYGVVGNDEVNEPWLDEALAEYSTIMYFEKKYGQEMKDKVFNNMVKAKYNTLDQYISQGETDEAILRPVYEFENEYVYDILVYGKGAMMLDALRQKVGNDAFDSILKEYYKQRAFTNATTQDFIEISKKISKMELDDFFDEWLIPQGDDQMYILAS